MQQSLARMATQEPELAARLLVQALPAASAPIQEQLDYRLVVYNVGSYEVSISNGSAAVSPVDGAVDANGKVDFELRTDAGTFVRMANGANPLGLLLNGRVRIRGKRRRALKLRKLARQLTMRDIARAGPAPDPDLLYRALPYAVDPEWTVGQRFCIEYEIQPDETELLAAGVPGSQSR